MENNKESKREKLSLDDILKDGDEFKKNLKNKKLKEEDWDLDGSKKKAEEEKKEQERIDKICCPSCSSQKKYHKQKKEDNGIFGPGFQSWVVEEYFVCLDCGTMFKDLEKFKK